MPFKLNNFSFHSVHLTKKVLNKLKSYQRHQITSLELQLDFPISYLGLWFFTQYNLSVPEFLPGLKRINVRVFPSIHQNSHFQETEDRVREELGSSLKNMSVEVKVEKVSLRWISYDRSFVDPIRSPMSRFRKLT